MDIREEYERVYHNYEFCLSGLEQILLYAQDKDDMVLSQIVGKILEHLVMGKN